MFVCLCYAVTERAVREAVAEGARDLSDLGRRLGAGTDCGQCRETLQRLIANPKNEQRASQ